jgi:hypothetical protein
MHEVIRNHSLAEWQAVLLGAKIHCRIVIGVKEVLLSWTSISEAAMDCSAYIGDAPSGLRGGPFACRCSGSLNKKLWHPLKIA